MYKILVVDDEKMIRMGIKKVIDWESLGIQEVFTAASAREALEIIEEYEPEIMITDIQMSEMTGLQLIKLPEKGSRNCGFWCLQAMIVLNMQDRACDFRYRISF